MFVLKECGAPSHFLVSRMAGVGRGVQARPSLMCVREYEVGSERNAFFTVIRWSLPFFYRSPISTLGIFL